MGRIIELSCEQELEIIEGTHLEDCAGAVVWDAALSLIYFLDQQSQGTGA
jgi:hypothetical protein